MRVSSELKALIVCDDDRRNSFAQMLRGKFGTIHAAAALKSFEDLTVDCTKLGKLQPAYDLALCHLSNLTIWRDLKREDPVLLIFSSHGVSKEQESFKQFVKPEMQVYAIPRVTDPALDITSGEIEDLLTWLSSSKRETTAPLLCLPKDSFRILPTLSILCQGYLLAHADEVSTSEAGAKMCRVAAFDSTSEGQWRRDYGEFRRQTESPDWWQKPFGLQGSPSQDFFSQLNAEWAKNDDGFETIVRLLEGDITPAGVNDAYLLIRKRLGGV